MKSARERMDVVNAYMELGSYRAAAELCGTTPKTVKRIIVKWKAGELDRPQVRPNRARNTDVVADLVAERVDKTRGRITAKRLLPEARAAGYGGSARNFRRIVARTKATWRRKARSYRPWIPSPGEHLVIDWGQEGDLRIFCAVLAWSRYRFVRFASDERRETTLRLLAECFEELGGVPAVVLADRMACLKASVVANVVVPHPDYVRFATHFGFRPDFCEAADPQSKGVVERLVGYAKSDLVIPSEGWSCLVEGNDAARSWCTEVNGRIHTEIAALPVERLGREREVLRVLPSLRPPLRRGVARKVDRLSTVRIGSARYSVPSSLLGTIVEVAASDRQIVVFAGECEVARHGLVAPGECSISDAHYDRPARAPRRAIRPRTGTERAFMELGATAEAFLRSAAAAGTPRLAAELERIVALHPAWDRADLTAALERATAFRRFSADDVLSVLAAGVAVPTVAAPGSIIAGEFPAVPVRALADYAMERS